MNDNSAGEIIDNSSGNPETLNIVYMQVGNHGACDNDTLEYMRFCYAGVGLFEGGNNYTELRHCQFVNCARGIAGYWTELDLNNCLFAGAGTGVDSCEWGDGINLVNVTLNVVTAVQFAPIPWWADPSYSPSFGMTNCLINGLSSFESGMTNAGYSLSGANNGDIANDTFQSAAGGNCYLAANSPYRNVGTANIRSDLLAELQQMTTYAPQDGGFPDTDQPDLGYHYPINEDSDYDGLPDWWEWKYFENYNHTGSDLDADNNTLLCDYANGFDPNVIRFDLYATNFYVNTMSVRLQINLNGGIPGYLALLINDTNLADASWQPYSGTNLTVNVGPTDGVYSVQVGLRGLPSDAQQTWQEIHLTLDTIPPAIIITNSGTITVSQPLIQVQCCANEDLSSLTYDVSNAMGPQTNQSGYLIDQFYDTNLLAFTTNYFQCYDIRLTNGLNVITLHAVDLAGNQSTINVSYRLDYSGDTTPPVLTVLWPQAGAHICGSSFTLQAQVDDNTASVTASISDDIGETNVVSGLVERNGLVWVDNLPLGDGTNTLTIMAKDAAGNVTTTNLTLSKNAVMVTMDPPPLNESSVYVTGLVSDPSFEVFVNDVQANVDPATGNWEANGVAVSPSGTAVFDVEIYAGSNPAVSRLESISSMDALAATPDGSQRFNHVQSAMLGLMSYHQNQRGGHYNYNIHWTYLSGGEGITSWPGGGVDVPLSAGMDAFWRAYWENASAAQASIKTHIMIEPSGKVGVEKIALYLVSARVWGEYFPERWWDAWQLDPQTVTIQGKPLTAYTNMDNGWWGWTLVTAPTGALPDVAPVTTAAQINSFGGPGTDMTVSEVKLKIIDANTGVDLTDQTTNVIVVQQMNLQCQLSVPIPNETPANFQWTVPGITFSNYSANDSSGKLYMDFPTKNSNVVFYWISGGIKQVQCSATFNGQIHTAQATFNVSRPMAQITTTGGTVALDNLYSFPYDRDRLHCGVLNASYVGMLFVPSVTMPDNYTGHTNLEWIQEVTYFAHLRLTNGVSMYEDVSPMSLDTSCPYGFDANPPNTDDSPASQSLAGFDQVSYSDDFTMWLMFKPDGDTAQWVPLRKVNWHWDGAGSLVTTGFEKNWVLTSTNNPGNPMDRISFDHPQWDWNANDTNHFRWKLE